MQFALDTSPQALSATPTGILLALDRSTVASVVALSRALELHDPALARRGALRAAVVASAAETLTLAPTDLAAAIGGALLAEVAALVTHARPNAERDVASAVLGASLLERVTGCAALADAVRHQFEQWDGNGAPRRFAGDAIPVAARLVAVAGALVGPVEAGGTPHWPTRAGRVRSLAGSAFEPTVVAAITDPIRAGVVPDERSTIDQAFDALDRIAAHAGGESPIEALTSIGAAIHAADRIDDVLGLIAGHVRRALGASTVGIARIDVEARAARPVSEVGDLAAATVDPANSYPLDEFPAASAFRSDAMHNYARSTLEATSIEAAYLTRLDAQSELAIPLDIEGRRWGVLWARTATGRNELGERDLATMRLAASQIMTSVAHASRVAELEALALRDPLTGLGNRRVLETTLRRIFSRSPIARQDCAVIICDVDGLKIVNDVEGHAAGDAVLVDAAAALRHAVAEVAGATVCRIGGDEFCVVLDGGGMLLGEPIATRAQKLFARSGIGRSMSCGVAVASIGVNSAGELLRAADEAQYLQKRSRRGGDQDLLDASGHGGRRARRDR